MADIREILDERGARYGVFAQHAEITVSLKVTLRSTHVWPSLAPCQMEALDMIAHKLGRIVNGDPNYADSWRDIAGYATLEADRLEGIER